MIDILRNATMVAAILASSICAAQAETVLRLDESPVGELDPAKASDYADSILMFNVYDTLVIGKQGAPGYDPFLASSWRQEGAAYEFKLRDNVKFQSGNALTADDVVFSFERMMAIGSGLSHLFSSVEKAEAIDAHTVRFTLKKEYSPFIASLTRLPIIDKKLVLANLGEGEGAMKDWGQNYLASHSAGTGAYRVVSHNPQEQTVMEKNPDFFQAVPAKAPDKVFFRYGLDASTVRTMIAQGQHDISSAWVPPEVLKSLADSGAQLLTEKGTTGFYIKMNTTKPPFDDPECRLAVSYAFDYDIARKMVSITDTVSQAGVSTGPIPVGILGSLPADQEQKRDLDKAREHLAKCKYNPADTTIELSWIGDVPLEERFALLMQANFGELGFKSEIVKVPFALFQELVSKPETTPAISQMYVDSVTGDTDTILYSQYHSTLGGTWQSPEYLKDNKVDELLDRGRTASDQADRAKVYEELSKHLKDVAPSIFAQDFVAVFAASNRVSVPALSEDSKRFLVPGYGFSFRLMEMKD